MVPTESEDFFKLANDVKMSPNVGLSSAWKLQHFLYKLHNFELGESLLVNFLADSGLKLVEEATCNVCNVYGAHN